MLFALCLAFFGLAAGAQVECDEFEDNECTKNLDAVDDPLEGAVMFQIGKHPHKSRGAENPSQSEADSDRKRHHDAKHAPTGILLEQAPADKVVTYGDKKCPCIGLEGLSGIQMAAFGQNITANYSMDGGSFCKAWDYGVHPLCPADGQLDQGTGWCSRPWCFVDPCNCDMGISPSKATFAAPTTFRQRPLYYSHATCSQAHAPEPMYDPMPAGMCEQEPQLNYGLEKCRCIGFDNIVDAGLSNASNISYPLYAGSSCQAWDNEYDPQCTETENPPDFCARAWCYVDPCSCSAVASVRSKDRMRIVWKGHSVYYSYETCGSADVYTGHFHASCENVSSSAACLSLEECIWTGASCVEAGKLACEIDKENSSFYVDGKSDVNSGALSHNLPDGPDGFSWLLILVAVSVLLGCLCWFYYSASPRDQEEGRSAQ